MSGGVPSRRLGRFAHTFDSVADHWNQLGRQTEFF